MARADATDPSGAAQEDTAGTDSPRRSPGRSTWSWSSDRPSSRTAPPLPGSPCGLPAASPRPRETRMRSFCSPAARSAAAARRPWRCGTSRAPLECPDGRVILEPEARSTLENALYTARLLRARFHRMRITLVTDRLHSPRAGLTFRSIGFTVTAAPAPWPPDNATMAARFGGLLYECAALLWYGLRIGCGAHRRAARALSLV